MEELPVFKFALREGLTDNKFIPTKGEPFATGYDVRSAPYDGDDIVLRPGQYFKIPLGFRAFPEEGWWFQLHPRSSSFVKKYMHNLIGIIDEHYSHEVLFAGQYIPEYNSLGADLIIKYGEAIGQIIPYKRQDINVKQILNKDFDELCVRRFSLRKGGIGSTDKEIK